MFSLKTWEELKNFFLKKKQKENETFGSNNEKLNPISD